MNIHSENYHFESTCPRTSPGRPRNKSPQSHSLNITQLTGIIMINLSNVISDFCPYQNRVRDLQRRGGGPRARGGVPLRASLRPERHHPPRRAPHRQQLRLYYHISHQVQPVFQRQGPLDHQHQRFPDRCSMGAGLCRGGAVYPDGAGAGYD